MNNRYEDRFAEIKAKRKKRNLIYKVLACIGCVVVGLTTFAMMTPAITMEQQDDQAAAAAMNTAVIAAEQNHETEPADDVNLDELDEQSQNPGNGTPADIGGETSVTDDSQNTAPSDNQAETGTVPESETESEQDVNEDQDDIDTDVQAVTEEQEDAAEYTSLTISNVIDNSETTGREPSDIQEFTFTVKLKNGAEPLADMEFPYAADEESGMQSFDVNGEAVITLKHEESITIQELPYNTTWHVVAEPCAGYLTDHRIDDGNIVDGANTGEQLLTAPASVEYINSEASYTLPETGGPGTILFVLGGCLMFLGAGALLLRRRSGYEA